MTLYTREPTQTAVKVVDPVTDQLRGNGLCVRLAINRSRVRLLRSGRRGFLTTLGKLFTALSQSSIICQGQIPLRYPGRRQVRDWLQTCSKLEFGL